MMLWIGRLLDVYTVCIMEFGCLTSMLITLFSFSLFAIGVLLQVSVLSGKESKDFRMQLFWSLWYN